MKVILLIILLLVLSACSGLKEFIDDYNRGKLDEALARRDSIENGDRTETVQVAPDGIGFENDPFVPNQSDHPVLMGI
jgi:hypothetical protein